MNTVDFQKVADRVKKFTRGIARQQFGGIEIQETAPGCDLVIEYTKSPCFDKGGQVLTLGIHFNNTDEASHARNILRYGEADLDAPLERRPVPGRDKPFDVNL